MSIILDGSTGITSDSSASNPAMTAKGNGSDVEGYIQLNCRVNSHGVKLKSPPHSSGQSYTMVLPDNQVAADKFLKVKSITGSGATAVGQLEYSDVTFGITHAEAWRVTTAYSTNSGNEVYPTNWEKDDHNNAGSLGASGMSQSGGVFTFPTTGIWEVTWAAYGRAANSSASTLNSVIIKSTNNNSSYTNASVMYFSIQNESTYNYGFGSTKFIIDVTDTSNVKVKLGTYSYNFVEWESSSNYNLNVATFIRLGDT